MRSEAGTTEQGIDEVLRAWSESCLRAGSDASHCAGVAARFLLSALASALVTDAASRELGRAARGWGSGFSSPVEVITSLTALREVVVGSTAEPEAGWTAAWLPVSPERYNRIVDQLMAEAVDAASSNLQAAARTDTLTGCANRLALNEDLERQLASARRSGLDLAVAMIDLDGLKQINDGRGHEAGDLALTALTATLQGALRGADRLYRIGGDEFVVLLPFTDAEGAKTMLRRAEKMPGPAFSWGVASLTELGAEALGKPELLLARADAALYAGRAARRTSPAVQAAPSSEQSPGPKKRLGGLLFAMAAALILVGSLVGLALPYGGPHNTRTALGRSRTADPTLPQLIPPITSKIPTRHTSSHRFSPPAARATPRVGANELDRDSTSRQATAQLATASPVIRRKQTSSRRTKRPAGRAKPINSKHSHGSATTSEPVVLTSTSLGPTGPISAGPPGRGSSASPAGVGNGPPGGPGSGQGHGPGNGHGPGSGHGPGNGHGHGPGNGPGHGQGWGGPGNGYGPGGQGRGRGGH